MNAAEIATESNTIPFTVYINHIHVPPPPAPTYLYVQVYGNIKYVDTYF